MAQNGELISLIPKPWLAYVMIHPVTSVEILHLVWNEMSPSCYPAVLPEFDEVCRAANVEVSS